MYIRNLNSAGQNNHIFVILTCFLSITWLPKISRKKAELCQFLKFYGLSDETKIKKLVKPLSDQSTPSERHLLEFSLQLSF